MKEILLNICLVAVGTALFKMLIPENSMKKQIGFLISCFFITALISFIKGGEWDVKGIDFDGGNTGYTDYVDFSQQVNADRKREIAAEMSARIRETLELKEIYPFKIYVIVNISGLYSISISEIKLVLPPDGDFAEASALVEKEVGPGIKVSIEVEESR